MLWGATSVSISLASLGSLMFRTEGLQQTCSLWVVVPGLGLPALGRRFSAALGHWEIVALVVSPVDEKSNASSSEPLHCRWHGPAAN